MTNRKHGGWGCGYCDEESEFCNLCGPMYRTRCIQQNTYRTLAVGGSPDDDGRAWILNATGEPLRSLEADFQCIRFACFSPDSTRLITMEFENSGPELWDVGTGEFISRLVWPEGCGDWDFAGKGIWFSGDGRFIYAAHNNEVIYGWRSETGELVSPVTRI